MKKQFLLALIIMISACSSTVSGKWSSCRKTDSKLGCASISEADKYAYDGDQEVITIKNKDDTYQNFKTEDIGGNQYVSRSRDKIGRLWIAPYMDKNNNFHEGSFVRVVDEESDWKVKQVKSNPSWVTAK
jgi:hypothetical protein